jgi:hypothetical protein
MIDISGQFVEALIIDPSTSFPVASKPLVFKRGSASKYAAIADGVNYPLGYSAYAPAIAGDPVYVTRFNAAIGASPGISAGVINIDDLVYSAANGLVADLTLAGHGTFWVIGVATKAATGPNQPITYIPCFPYSATQ